jgi:hypothetical protein
MCPLSLRTSDRERDSVSSKEASVRKAKTENETLFLGGPSRMMDLAASRPAGPSARGADISRNGPMRYEEFSNVEGNGYFREPARDAGRDFGRRSAL